MHACVWYTWCIVHVMMTSCRTRSNGNNCRDVSMDCWNAGWICERAKCWRSKLCLDVPLKRRHLHTHTPPSNVPEFLDHNQVLFLPLPFFVVLCARASNRAANPTHLKRRQNLKHCGLTYFARASITSFARACLVLGSTLTSHGISNFR